MEIRIHIDANREHLILDSKCKVWWNELEASVRTEIRHNRRVLGKGKYRVDLKTPIMYE
jgi:hypothetical protein